MVGPEREIRTPTTEWPQGLSLLRLPVTPSRDAGAGERSRTPISALKRRALCRLSYAGEFPKVRACCRQGILFAELLVLAVERDSNTRLPAYAGRSPTDNPRLPARKEDELGRDMARDAHRVASVADSNRCRTVNPPPPARGNERWRMELDLNQRRTLRPQRFSKPPP